MKIRLPNAKIINLLLVAIVGISSGATGATIVLLNHEEAEKANITTITNEAPEQHTKQSEDGSEAKKKDNSSDERSVPDKTMDVKSVNPENTNANNTNSSTATGPTASAPNRPIVCKYNYASQAIGIEPATGAGIATWDGLTVNAFNQLMAYGRWVSPRQPE